MKVTTQTNKAKIKVIKSGSKKTKAKLPQYKSRNKLVRGKKESFHKCVIMNSSSTEVKNVPSTLSSVRSVDDKHWIPQYSINRKKKKSCSSTKEFSTKTQHSMGVSFEESDDSAEATLATDKHYKEYYDNLKQQRKLGSPVVVEALSGSLSLLKIPQIFKQNQETRKENNACDYKLSLAQSISSQKNEACIIVAKSVNPQSTPSSTGNETRKSSPLKNNCEQRKDVLDDASSSKNNTIGDDLDYSWNSSETTLTFEKKNLENMIVGIIDTDKSVLKETISGPATIKKNRKSISNDQCQLRFYCLKNKVVVIMPAKTQFSFIGKIVVKVLYGAIGAYGCIMTTKTEPTEIYSARGYSSISIETSEKFLQDNESNIWASFEAEGINRDKKNKLVTDIDNVQPGMAVILLANFENVLTKFLETFYPFRLFPKIKNVFYQSWTNRKRAEVILQSHLFVDRCASKESIIDQCMVQDISDKMLNNWRANERSCTLIAGGRSVGKSTTVRFLINRILPVSKKVVLVDVDPGQPECTPLSCISVSVIEKPLIGPNFTHLNTPVFQLYIDEIDVSRCIVRYIEGLKMLIDKVSSCPTLSCLPIIVNTMGFVQNIGWDIIILTIKLMQPFLVVQILSEKPKNNYPGYLSKEVVNEQELLWTSWSTNIVDCNRPCNHELRVIRSYAERKSTSGTETWIMKSYQKRELVLVSYLSKIVQSSGSVTSYYDDISYSFNAAMPYVAPFSSLSILIQKSFAPQSHALNVINGNIVALCGIEREDDDESQDVQDTISPRVLNRSSPCVCYGFGLVRGVDIEQKEIYINTPLSISMMRQVNCLAGCIPVPIMLLKLNQNRNVPYTGGSDVLPTSREPRRGYFRMRHNQ